MERSKNEIIEQLAKTSKEIETLEILMSYEVSNPFMMQWRKTKEAVVFHFETNDDSDALNRAKVKTAKLALSLLKKYKKNLEKQLKQLL